MENEQTVPPEPTQPGVTEAIGEFGACAADIGRQLNAAASELRDLVRGQPLAMSVIMIGLGYIIGRMSGGLRRLGRYE